MSQLLWVVQQEDDNGCNGCEYLAKHDKCPEITHPWQTEDDAKSKVCTLLNSVHGGSHIWLKELKQ